MSNVMQMNRGETVNGDATRARGLKPILVHDRSCLDVRSIASALFDLSRLTPWKTLLAMGLDWAVALGCIWAATRWPSWWATVIAWVTVASRQHALLVLMHEGAHRRLLNDRPWNDRWANWFMGYPLFVSVESYRRLHLDHHYHTNTEQDPDWVTKIENQEWEFPKSKGKILLVLARQLFGMGALQVLWLIIRYAVSGSRTAASSTGNSTRAHKQTPALKGLYYAAMVGLITAMGWWGDYLLYWLTPALTVLPLLLRLRSIAEHFGLYDRNHDLDNTRNYHVSLWERLTIAPHNIHLHLDHHLFPTIPYYNLPKAHALLNKLESYREQAHQNGPFFGAAANSVWKDITRFAEEAR